MFINDEYSSRLTMNSYNDNLINYLAVKSNRFKLDESFIETYKNKQQHFGFNGLGEFVYLRSYSRLKDNGEKERWFETVQRVVQGTYDIQKAHIISNGLHWNEKKSQRSAQKMYEYMFDMKFLPPGRGLWAMGTDIIYKKGLFGALNNCAFVSTENIDIDFSKPFMFMADQSMQGAGVGFDLKGAGKVMIESPKFWGYKPDIFEIPDTREGWVEAIGKLIDSYTNQIDDDRSEVFFDYYLIRPAGVPLKTFGGISSGYEPLEEALEDIRKILEDLHDKPITERAITDIMNIIGKCIVAGGIRRTAQIVFGKGKEFIELKDYQKHPERLAHGWVSNNTVFKEVGDNYDDITPYIAKNGEPGVVYLENMKKFGRMGVNSQEKYLQDKLVVGANPCLEQSLENMEMCCLVETFPNHCENFMEFKDVLKYAYLYAKTVTLGRTNWKETNQVMLKNRRIGTSVSGIRQFIAKNGLEELRIWLDEGYKHLQSIDDTYSAWFAIPKSIKTTSVKPSGSVSLLAGATPGIHHNPAGSRYYKRRVHINNNSEMYEYAISKGYEIEAKLEWKDGVWEESKDKSVVVFYCDSKTEENNSDMWEQLNLTAFMQEWWADNQVSVTIGFEPDKDEKKIGEALDFFQYRIKGAAFLPKTSPAELMRNGYMQLVYEPVTKEVYDDKLKTQTARKMLKENDIKSGFNYMVKFANDVEMTDKYCNNDQCQL